MCHLLVKMLFFIFFYNVFIPCLLSRDHGDLDKKHIQVARDFKEEKFKIGRKFSREKIYAFLNFLREERRNLAKDIFETRVMEDIELNIKKLKKSKKKATDFLNRSVMLQAYDEELIPRIVVMHDLAIDDSDDNEERLESLSDEFISYYLPFYVPNAHRSVWPRDMNIGNFTKKLFKRYSFYAGCDSDLAEASNLIIDENNKNIALECLQDIKVGEYLSASAIKSLCRCGVDLSVFDPGISSLWEPVSNISRVKKNGPE